MIRVKAVRVRVGVRSRLCIGIRVCIQPSAKVRFN